MQELPKVGVGVFVLKDGKLLMGKRKNTHGEGTWSLPGGHLEFNESIEDCAIRETKEETGLELKNVRLGPFTNDILKDEGKHYITIFVLADHTDGEPETLEPEKCEKWEWVKWDKLPEPLFLPLQNLLKQNYSPFQD